MSWSQLFLAAIVASLCATTACIQPRYAAQASSYDNYMAQQRVKYSAENRAFIAEVETGKVPKDYKKQVDGWMAANLKDPASRQVEFGANTPHLACGTVNAKNSYGGYTGKQPFTAWFTADGKLKDLMLWDSKSRSTWVNKTSEDELGHQYYWLLKSCGFA